jgi:hypothetical protein
VLDRDDVSSVQKNSNRRSVPDGCVQPEAFSPALFSSDPPPPLQEQLEEPLARGGANAALGDQRGDEAGRGHVEGVVGGGAVGAGVRRTATRRPSSLQPSIWVTSRRSSARSFLAAISRRPACGQRSGSARHRRRPVFRQADRRFYHRRAADPRRLGLTAREGRLGDALGHEHPHRYRFHDERLHRHARLRRI